MYNAGCEIMCNVGLDWKRAGAAECKVEFGGIIFGGNGEVYMCGGGRFVEFIFVNKMSKI